MGDGCLVSDKVNKIAQETEAHSQRCMCQLCVPNWGSLDEDAPPVQHSEMEDIRAEGAAVSLTEWAEQAADRLLARV